MPEPSACVLHMLLLSGRISKKEKKVKDLEIAMGLGEYLATHEDRVAKMKEMYRSLPVKWKKEILEIAKEHLDSIYRILHGR